MLKGIWEYALKIIKAPLCIKEVVYLTKQTINETKLKYSGVMPKITAIFCVKKLT